MKQLNLSQMENLNGGGSLECASYLAITGGITLAAVGMFGPFGLMATGFLLAKSPC